MKRPQEKLRPLGGIKAVSIAPAQQQPEMLSSLVYIARFAVSNDSHQIERARIKRLRAPPALHATLFTVCV